MHVGSLPDVLVGRNTNKEPAGGMWGILNKIYPLTAQEVPGTQRVETTLKHCFKRNHVFDKDFDIRLVDEISVVCKNGRIVIPKPLQRRAVLWFHHYL